MLITQQGDFTSNHIKAGKMTYVNIVYIDNDSGMVYGLPTLVDIKNCYIVDED